MNAGTLSGSARVVVAALVLAAAIGLGLIVGNAIGQRAEAPQTHGGAVPGWPGSIDVYTPRTADTSFSLEAIEQLNAIRIHDVTAAESAHDTSDYALRHPAEPSSDGPSRHEGLRKRAPDASSTEGEPARLNPTLR